eukprot:NODE_83_length_22457_cov_0.375794.p12 type:complete len:128 gc:universal NODE_83_length_22457_cov_0.375794:15522-15905(+)
MIGDANMDMTNNSASGRGFVEFLKNENYEAFIPNNTHFTFISYDLQRSSLVDFAILPENYIYNYKLKPSQKQSLTIFQFWFVYTRNLFHCLSLFLKNLKLNYTSLKNPEKHMLRMKHISQNRTNIDL